LIKAKKIIIIIQRSNGDVFFSSSLIKRLYEYFEKPQIDLLVNDDTLSIAKLIPYVTNIYTFSYKRKQDHQWSQELNIIFKLFKKYDLSINLTSSDRSILYALMMGRKSISAVENDNKKSWWKKILLSHYYFFNDSQHILLNNLMSLNLLKIKFDNIHHEIGVTEAAYKSITKKLKKANIDKFLIFHPSTQYEYKIYPQKLRNLLLQKLSKLNISIVVTGGTSLIDSNIKDQLNHKIKIIDFIGETSLEEFFALSKLSLGYIGMDTLNMHIAASQNKRIFAIFGPTNLKMWSPWSNKLKLAANIDMPLQTYGNITIFQADMPCVACGKAGCNDNHGNSDCLDNIKPEIIFNEVKNWNLKSNNYVNNSLEVETYTNPRRVVLYIVYGDDQTYYDGALFSLLTFKYWILDKDQIEIFILTEKPEFFANYPVKTILMTQEQKNEWSLNGQYHFRIKNRGFASVMDQLGLKSLDKILFFDTDTYFHKSPLPLFDLIQSDQALFYLNEGLIYKRKRFDVYVKNLEGKKIIIDSEQYELSRKSEMWGSLMMGIVGDMRSSLDYADKLMKRFFKIVPAHTIEPFSFSETLRKKYKLVEGKKYVKLYSTSRKKEHAKNILVKFFQENNALKIQEQIRLAQKVKIKRSIFIVLKQRFQILFKK
jgi:heptosyltransferase III